MKGMNRLSIILVFFSAISVFQGCSGASGDQQASIAGGRSADAPAAAEPEDKAAAARPEGTRQEAKIDSVYTDISEKNCKTTELNEDEGWSVQRCKGAFGYDLEVTEGDLRQSVNVIGPKGRSFELNLPSLVSPAFSYLGEKAEWRFRERDGKKVPFALIVRFNANEDPNDSKKVNSYLTVSKISDGEICVTDVVKPMKNANEKARELALGSADKPCLKAK